MNYQKGIVGNLINEANENSINKKIGPIILKDYQLSTCNFFVNTNFLRSFLLLWDTGFGKTITAVAMINEARKKYPKMRILLLVKVSLKEDPWSKTIRSLVDGLIDHIKILTYDNISFQEHLRSYLQNIDWQTNRIIIVVDEAHKLLSKIRAYPEIGELIHNVIFKTPTDIYSNRILLCTATPFINNKDEFKTLMSITRPGLKDFDINDKLELNVISPFLLGLASVKLTSIGFCLTDKGPSELLASRNIKYHEIEMSDYQSSLFKEATKRDYESKAGGLRTFRRLTNNIVFEGLKIKEGITEEEYIKFVELKLKNFLNEPKTEDLLKRCSSKYYETVKLISQTPGKVLVYLNFVKFEGVQTFLEYLKFFNISAIVFDHETRHEVDVFNSFDNENGNIIKVCIFTRKGSEGVSFNNINDLFLLDIPWNNAALRQIIGRGLRLHSHTIPSRYYINVHVMIGIPSNNVRSIDKEMLELINSKEEVIAMITESLNETSIETLSNFSSSDINYPRDFILSLEMSEPKKFIRNISEKMLVPVYIMISKDSESISVLLDKDNDKVYLEDGTLFGEIDKSSVSIIDKKLVYRLK